MVPWEVQADEFVTCNCDYGCPCQFSAPPTHGHCQAIAGMIIHKGHFGDVRLDGLKTASVLRWPGAIHEGNGEAYAVIDENATEEQRSALLTIMSGKETEPFATMWNVFASTLVNAYDPVFKPVHIEVDVEARIGKVRVDGLIETDGEPIRNPVSGEPERARIDLVGGFEYEIAEMGSANGKSTGPIEVEWQNAYAQFAHIHLNNQGIIPTRQVA